MKYALRFLVIYIVIVASLGGFYYIITKEYRQSLALIDKEIVGLEYIKDLNLLTNNIIEYKTRLDINGKNDALEVFKEEIIKEIYQISSLRRSLYNAENEALTASLNRFISPYFKDESLYEILELINGENYHIGDLSGLFFQSDRKMYYLNSLLTHYLPEYIISLSIVRSLIEYKYKHGSMDKIQEHTLIEQKKLVFLSANELSTIVKFLEPYKTTKKLQKTMLKVKKQLDEIEASRDNTELYLEKLTTLLLYSHRLNKLTINTLEKLYKEKRYSLQKSIVWYKSFFIFAFIVVTFFAFYLRNLFIINLNNERSIHQLNDTLDTLVVFSRTDKDGFVTHVSDAFLKLSGFAKDVFIGRVDPIFKDSGFHPEKNYTREVKNRAKDGSYYWLQLQIIPEKDKDDNVVAYMVYGVDITYQKEIEAEKVKTQEALSFKSKFLSNMSHEIRTPLNGIIGFTTIALKTKLDAHQKDLMNKIKSTSDLLLGIINDILDISKIESGKMEIEIKEFDLRELLQNVIGILEPKADEKGIDFLIEYDNIGYYYYEGDTLRITQVLTNLLSNAIKFTDEGYVKIKVKLDEESRLLFEVQDSGIGLKEESLISLFEEFTQADMSTSRKYGGTGLGLSISKNLVQLMGGTIYVESDYGKGSSFFVSLPLKKAENYQVYESEAVEDLESVTQRVNALENIRILVAEDNKMNQMVLEMLLEDSSLTLEFADDGEKAVSLFKSKKYDLVLMDLQMPNLDGYGATKEIREVDKDVPIIALSANVLQEDIERAFQVGMNAYLSKPIELQKLYNVIIKYTEKRSS
jgi:PAS domain S-box-containing protein